MIRFRSLRTALAVAFFLFALSLVTGKASAANALTAPQPAQHGHGHVRGVARLGVAFQDITLTIQLESPLDSMIGFKHRTSTLAQPSAIATLLAKMRAPQGLILVIHDSRLATA